MQYQGAIEQIIEENAQEKYELFAEIKVMYKKADPNDAEAMAEKQNELDQVKDKMNKLKD